MGYEHGRFQLALGYEPKSTILELQLIAQSEATPKEQRSDLITYLLHLLYYVRIYHPRPFAGPRRISPYL